MARHELKMVRYQWQTSSCGTVIVCGTVLRQEQVQDATSLANWMAGIELKQLKVALKQLSGFFALVLRTQNAVVLVTDIVRSIPLFYRRSADLLLISDDCSVLAETRQNMNPLSSREFTAVGYVTGTHTLYQDVFQAEAASFVSCVDSGISSQNYFVWQRAATEQGAEQQLLAELDRKLTATMKLTVAQARGRQIVVPLSGGYDSRAILLYLKKTGYPKIVTFTFGAAASAELPLAATTARKLGIPWRAVVYTASMWRSLRSEPEFQQYLQFVCNGVSAPNVQLWPALRQLLREGYIEADALLVPGHTGDFVTGGHLSGNEQQVALTDLHQAAVDVYRKYYQLDRLTPDHELLRHIQAVCSKLWHSAEHWTAEELLEAWNWQERQSKYIVNSNRYYEFFGLQWWLPLWHQDFIQFWLAVPKSQLRQQKLWRQLLRQQCQLAGLEEIDSNAVSHNGRFDVIKMAFNYFFDRNLLLWLVPFHQWLLYRLGWSKHSGTLNSYLTRLLLKLHNDIPKRPRR